MDLNKLNKQLEQFLELYKKEVEQGTKIEANNYADAIDKIVKLFDEGKLDIYYPDAFNFDYRNGTYGLWAVSGKLNKDGKITYGIGHALQKHAGEEVDGKLVTKEQLIGALKNTEAVLRKCLQKRQIVYNWELNRIIFENNGFVYAIILPKDNKEVCYLQTVFKANRTYMDRLKRKLKIK